MIRDLPNRGQADRVVAGLGPGSFTGVRIAIATARALSFAWQGEHCGYPTLALVAAMARAQAGKVPVAVAMTGGHGEWFVQRFDADGHSNGALVSLSPQMAAEIACEHVVAGNQAEALVTLRGSGVALPIVPDARAFALLAEDALLDRLDPIYGRGPDARLPGVA